MKVLAIDCAASLCAACVYDAAAKRALVLPTNNFARIEPISVVAKVDAAKTAAP